MGGEGRGEGSSGGGDGGKSLRSLWDITEDLIFMPLKEFQKKRS